MHPLSPRRTLVLPFLLAFAPMLWFAARDVSGATSAAVVRYALLAAGSTSVSYLGAVVVTRGRSAVVSPDSWIDRVLFRPTDGTLALVATLTVAAIGYLTASAFDVVPGWVDVLAVPLGVLTIPLVVCYGGLIVLIGALSISVPFWVEVVAVAAGTSLSALWTFLLATAMTTFARKFSN